MFFNPVLHLYIRQDRLVPSVCVCGLTYGEPILTERAHLFQIIGTEEAQLHLAQDA